MFKENTPRIQWEDINGDIKVIITHKETVLTVVKEVEVLKGIEVVLVMEEMGTGLTTGILGILQISILRTEMGMALGTILGLIIITDKEGGLSLDILTPIMVLEMAGMAIQMLVLQTVSN